MSDPAHDFRELDALIDRIAEQTPSELDRLRLNELLLESEAARLRYIDHLTLQADLLAPSGPLARIVPSSIFSHLASQFDNVDAEILQELIAQSAEKNRMEDVKRSTAQQLHRKANPPPQKASEPRIVPVLTYLVWRGVRSPRFLSGFGTAVAALLALAALVYFLTPPSTPPGEPTQTPSPLTVTPPIIIEEGEPIVGEFVVALDAVWSGPSAPTRPGTPMRAGNIELLEGQAELKMRDGTRLILSSPSLINLTTGHSIELIRGTLTGYCPPSAQGFTVQTPNARVIDLGTEFGISVPNDSDTEITVFEGKVQAGRVQPDSRQTIQTINLTAGQTAQASAAASTLALIDRPQGIYTRELVLPIDVLDIVAGGDGHGRARHAGINPSTGARESLVLTAGENHQGEDEPPLENPTYQTVDWSRFVDGVFVPGQVESLDRIASDGTRFDQMPQTGQQWLGPIWAVGPRADLPASLQNNVPKSLWAKAMKDIESTGINGEGMLAVHANAGITFDLQALRQANTGWNAKRLTGRFTNAETTPGAHQLAVPGDPDRVIMIDLYILLDGKLVKHEHQYKRSKGIIELDIPLPQDANMLTLIVTDTNGSYAMDWGVIIDPVIEMTPDR